MAHRPPIPLLRKGVQQQTNRILNNRLKYKMLLLHLKLYPTINVRLF